MVVVGKCVGGGRGGVDAVVIGSAGAAGAGVQACAEGDGCCVAVAALGFEVFARARFVDEDSTFFGDEFGVDDVDVCVFCAGDG